MTHHYAGLSFGNEASTRHRFQVSNRNWRRSRALKMKALSDRRFPQAVIPPQERPNVGRAAPAGFQWHG
ncbi:N-succinylarginine dihydrolase [Shigella flexneri]